MSTSDRHAAKLSLLQRFEAQFDRFIMCGGDVMNDISDFFGMTYEEGDNRMEINLIEEHELMTFKRGMRLRARFFILAAILLFVVYIYVNKNYTSGGGD